MPLPDLRGEEVRSFASVKCRLSADSHASVVTPRAGLRQSMRSLRKSAPEYRPTASVVDCECVPKGVQLKVID
jgi:hypothetical protein